MKTYLHEKVEPKDSTWKKTFRETDVSWGNCFLKCC